MENLQPMLQVFHTTASKDNLTTLNFFVIKKKKKKFDVSITLCLLMNDQITQYNYLMAFSNWLKMF